MCRWSFLNSPVCCIRSSVAVIHDPYVENGLDDVRPAANLCQECGREPSLMPSCVHCEQCKDGRALCEGRSYHCDLCGNIGRLKHGYTDMTYTPWNDQTSCSRRPSGRSAMTCNVPPMPSR